VGQVRELNIPVLKSTDSTARLGRARRGVARRGGAMHGIHGVAWQGFHGKAR